MPWLEQYSHSPHSPLITLTPHHMQSQIKDYQGKIEESNRARDSMATKQREMEKKVKGLEAELNQSQEEKTNAERSRRSAEAERDDLQDELSSATSKA